MTVAAAKLEGVEAARGASPSLSALAGRHIYFGHQSVGYDILAGAEELLRERGVTNVRVVDSGDPSALATPGIVHSKIGSNSDPLSKLQAFTNFMAAGAGDKAELAMMKFCYVDIEQNADVDAIFAAYERTFRDLAARYPRVAFLHCTVPLTSRPGGWKNQIKMMLGKPLWGDEQNRRRHLFNEKLRAFGGERVFDIAALESDAGATIYRMGGETLPCMNPAYTNDGGHLNTQGKRKLGQAFLEFLAQHAARGEGRR